MKNFLIICFLILTNIQAHTLIMNVLDNEDNTITVVGEFSTGQKAVDAMIRLEALNSGDILFQKRLPDEGEFTLQIPKEPYQIVLDGGPGHQIVKEGISPVDGYATSLKELTKTKKVLSQNVSSKNEWSLAYIVLISITLLLILLTIYYSKRNTDKIIKMIQENN